MHKRIMIVALCVLSLLMTMIPFAAFGMEFSDVPITAPYYTAVDRLSNDGVIMGRGNGAYGPSDRTTRKEFCAFVARANNFNDKYYNESNLPFTDVKQDDWAERYIAFCYDNRFINGIDEKIFAPDDFVTCEQAVKIVVCSSGLGDESLSKVGPKWYSGYLNVAKKNNLLDGAELEVSQPADRAFVAQVVYNSVLAKGSNKSSVNAIDVTAGKTKTTPVKTAATQIIYEPEEIWEPGEDWNYYQYYGEDYQEYVENEENLPEPEENGEYKYVPVGSSDGILICIDPGHNYSGVDTGAVGNGLREQDITFYIASKLKPMLERNGFSVIMTRNSLFSNVSTESVSESLAKRAQIANSNKADLFVSIHCNASNGEGTGTETYYCTGSLDGKVFATFVQGELSDVVGLGDRGVKNAKYAVLKNTDMTAILVETAFIDNENDAEYLAYSDSQEDFAEAIARGICDYVGVDFQ